MKKKLKDVISKEFKGLWGTDFSDDGIPVIKTNNMTYEGRIDFSDICIRNIPYKEAENNFLKKGDLIIEKSGGTKTHSVGYVNIFEGEDDKYVCNNFILPLRPNTELVFPKYLFWQLHGMYEAGRFSDCYNKTTGIQNLQKKTYFSKDINLPSKEEQIKIAAELDTIQSAIDNKKQQLALLDEAVKSKFVEMFGENPVESGKWKVAKWADKVRITNGRDYKKLVVKTGLYPVYGSGGDMGIRVDDYLCSENTVIIGRKGNIDKPIFVKEKFWNVDTAFGLNVDESEINPYYFFEHSKKYNYRSMDTGVTIPSLTKTALFELKLAIPPLDIQNQFAAFVQQIDKSKSLVKQQLADLQELLDSKMQEYFGA